MVVRNDASEAVRPCPELRLVVDRKPTGGAGAHDGALLSALGACLLLGEDPCRRFTGRSAACVVHAPALRYTRVFFL